MFKFRKALLFSQRGLFFYLYLFSKIFIMKGKGTRGNSSAGKSGAKRLQKAEAKAFKKAIKYGDDNKKTIKATDRVAKITKRKYKK